MSSESSSSPAQEYYEAEKQWERKQAAAAAGSDNNNDNDDSRFEIQNRWYVPSFSIKNEETIDEEHVKKVVASVLNWNTTSTTINEWTVTPITGGITNRLLKVSGLSKAQPSSDNNSQSRTIQGDSVLVRIFGGEGMIDRHLETALFCILSDTAVGEDGDDHGDSSTTKQEHKHYCIAPPYYGRFGNGRLEGWMDGMKELQVPDLREPHVLSHMPLALAQLHGNQRLKQRIQAVVKGYVQDQPAPAPPADDSPEAETEPGLWSQIDAWWNQATSFDTFKTDRDTERARELMYLYHDGDDDEKASLKLQLDWLKHDVTPKDATISFCHNDLLAANIMANAAHDHIQLIDFEYGGMNYAAFDIANHWNEFAGGTTSSSQPPNYDWRPSDEQQHAFLRQYLNECQRLKMSNGDKNDNQQTEKEELEHWYHHVQAFLLVNHMYWGLWAVNQAAMEGTESFDYLNYAKCRIEQYRLDKKQKRWLGA